MMFFLIRTMESKIYLGQNSLIRVIGASPLRFVVLRLIRLSARHPLYYQIATEKFAYPRN